MIPIYFINFIIIRYIIIIRFVIINITVNVCSIVNTMVEYIIVVTFGCVLFVFAIRSLYF